jgi:AcrR family transcriptional regulator
MIQAVDKQKHNQKNRPETEAKLIRAVGEVLAERGFAKLGVNAVARQAGVDKVLIYRYFDDLDGLLQAYAKSSDFWPSSIELLGDSQGREQLKTMPFAQAFTEVFRRYANALRSRPLTLEILSWETIERNALTIALEEVREAAGLELMAFMSNVNPPSADWQAIANIFSGAIHYLAIRSRKVTVFSGMSIANDDDWERLIASIEFLIKNLPTDNTSKHLTKGN